jgi:predicted hotdog family 3-hydroxylacyl-ACP dehydratase
MTQHIEREQILQMIPHAGAMCLLDAVLHWDDFSIRCRSRRYRDQDNPMRRADGTLGAACGVEIAAQAMAVHGGLISTNESAPSLGYLVSLRDVQLRTGRLDAVEGDLTVDAERLMGDANGATYRFLLTAKGIELLSGRATVLLRVGK